jgi:hypothetical protein
MVGKTKMDNVVKITSDARFRLARSLMTSGGGGGGNSSDNLEKAIDIFASLLEDCRNRHGETSLNAALCYFEYGNALFRAVVRRKPMDGDETTNNDDNESEGDKKPAAKPGASAASRKRSLDDDNTKETDDTALSNKKAKTENTDEDDNDDTDEDDVALALEMLSTSFSIFDWHSTWDDDGTKTAPDEDEKQYSLTQIPRILCTIGDIHSYCGKFGNAVDAYCRALPYRENACKERQEANKGESLSVEGLKCQRLLVETYALVAEALLACKEGEDVVCVDDQEVEEAEEEEEDANNRTATAKKSGKNKEGKVLVAAKDRIDFAQSHYETAREKLQDIGKLTCFWALCILIASFLLQAKLCCLKHIIRRYIYFQTKQVYQMGKMAAAKIDLGDEKKDIGYLVMMLVGVGNSLEPLKTK